MFGQLIFFMEMNVGNEHTAVPGSIFPWRLFDFVRWPGEELEVESWGWRMPMTELIHR